MKARDHDGHDHERSPFSRRPLYVAFAITSILAIVQLVGALAVNSLALSADSAHMFSDVAALLIAIIAAHFASRPPSPQHSFGWQRSEVVAAQINGLLLLLASGWIVLEAVKRISRSPEVHGTGLLVFAAIGLAGNLVATAILHRAQDQNVNVRAAALHTLSDAAGSFGALVAGVLIAVWDVRWADPVASIAIALLVVISALRLLNITTRVLLEGAPPHVDVDEIRRALENDDSVDAVHHLHVWGLTPTDLSLSAHVELADVETLHDAQAEGHRLKELLAERFGVGHSTLELECHRCEVADHTS